MQAVSTSPGAELDPGAAAARYTEAGGGELETGATLVVYRLGAEAFHVAVLREAGDRWLVASELRAEIGGRDFDELLLAYESGRHRDADPGFWDRIDGPAGADDEALRAGLLEEIRRARERLSDVTEAAIAIPGATMEPSIGRFELEARIRDLVEQTVDLVEEVLRDASVSVGDLSGLLLVGGAARTPLVAAELGRRFGIEAVFSDGPPPYRGDGSEGEPAAVAAIDGPPPGRRRVLARAGVLAVALLALVAAGAVFGTRLGDHESPQAQSETGGAAPEEDERSEAGGEESRTPDDADSGGSGGQESPRPEGLSGPAGEHGSPEASSTPSGEQEDSSSEAAPEGAVPDLIGLSAAEAGEELSAAGFAEVEYAVEERSIFDFSHENCEVVGQDPGPGSEEPFGETITVTFSHTDSDGSGCFE